LQSQNVSPENELEAQIKAPVLAARCIISSMRKLFLLKIWPQL